MAKGARIRFRVEDHASRWEGLRELGKKLTKRGAYVKVGLLGARAQKKLKAHGGLTNVELGMIHEFGAPSRGIPERSWIRSTFDAMRSEHLALIRKLVVGIYDQKISPKQALGLIGAKVAADIKKRVTTGEGIPPPLAEETTRRKGSDRPLVDTGRMVGAVSWRVVMGGKETELEGGVDKAAEGGSGG